MELLKHELYKIFSKKIVYITILFFLLVTIFLIKYEMFCKIALW